MHEGDVLGRYEIRQKIGEGGMGEVFLAYDGQLARDVVLKMLLPKFTENVDLVGRFKQEAKAVSALNHPNIITIYEIVESQDASFIVYEFIKGETLREKIKRNQLTIAESVRIVEQIASGLQAAHNSGIIHRDIKPENIMIRDDGYVRILDFGLAKRGLLEGENEGQSAQVKTKEGTIMGSVQYMSPEQARGEKMDERTDIWSLGVVFYEMLTGISPFAGKTLGDSIALVLQGKPQPPREMNQNIPAELQSIVGKTLEKDRENRYSNIETFVGELRAVNVPQGAKVTESATLQYAQNTAVNSPDISRENTLIQDTQPVINVESERQLADVKTVRKRNPWRWVMAALIPLSFLFLAIVALASFGGWYYYTSGRQTLNIPFQNSKAEKLTKDQVARLPAISPDGKTIAYVRNKNGKQVLIVRRIESDGETQLFEAFADSILDVSFTPNGESVNFLLEDHGLGMVFQIPAIGGEPKIIAQDVRSNLSYSPDGKRYAFIRFDIPRKLSRVMISSADGTEPKELINTKDSGFVLFKDLAWSPDGKNLLMVVLDGRPGKPFKYNLGILQVDLAQGKKAADEFRILEKDGCCLVSSAKWLKDGSGVVMLSRKQEDKTRQIYFVTYPGGISHRLTDDASNYSSLDVSADGTKMIAGTEKLASSIWEIDIASGKSKQISEESEGLDNITDIETAADGNLYYSMVDLSKGTCNISYFDPKKAVKQQFTLGGCVRGISFSPDGKFIFTSANLKGKGQQSIMRLDRNARNPIQITKTPDVLDYLPQAGNSNSVFFNRLKIDGSFPKLMKVSYDGGESKTVYADPNQLELYPKISPDGKYLAYNEFVKGDLAPTSKLQIKVVEINNGSVGNTVLEKTINQPTRFGWTADSMKLIYIDPETLMNVKSISLNGKTEESLTEFNSHNIYGPPVFSKDGKTMYVVRTIQIRDLVLIRDAAKIEK